MLLKRTFTIADIERVIPDTAVIDGNRSAVFSALEPIFEAGPGALSWVRGDLKDKEGVVLRSGASIIVCDSEFSLPPGQLKDRCLIRVARPQIAFLRILNDLFAPPVRRPGIHGSAIIDAQAEIGQDVYIGPFATIGRSSIGDGCVIESFTSVGDEVTLGRGSVLREHVSIGGQGFGHIVNEAGRLENMVHLGRVIIGENVDLFPYVNVDRATLGSTVIGNGAKVDHYCHIGHNTSVGQNAVITARVTLCGGAAVGDGAWIGVHSVLRDGIRVGESAIVGMCSTVTRDVPSGETWLGSPARPIEEYKKLQSRLRELLG